MFLRSFLLCRRWLIWLLVMFGICSCTLLSMVSTPSPSVTQVGLSPTPDQNLPIHETPIPQLAFTESPTLAFLSTLQATGQTSPPATPWYTNYLGLPPGQYLVYTEGDSGQLAIDVSGKIKQRLTVGEDHIFRPFNANGQQMMYTSEGIFDWETKTVKLSHYSFPHGSNGCETFEVSPALDWVVSACLGQKRVVVFSLIGSEQYILMGRDASDYYFIDPQWSPDGKWISFSLAYPSQDPVNTSLGMPDAGFYLLDTSCLSEPNACPEKQHGPFKVPANVTYGYVWSPDSRFVAFTAPDGSAFQIFDVQSGEFHSVRAVGQYGGGEWKAWSPDGVWLAYTYADEGIYLMPAAGGRPVHLVSSDDIVLISGWITVRRPMKVGNTCRVTRAGANLNLRSAPSLSGKVLHSLQPGEQVILLDGPIGAEGYRWWKMRALPDSSEGWAAEHPDWYEVVGP